MGTGQPRITKTEYYALAMEGRLEQPTRHTYTLANTLCVAPTQRGSALSIYILRAMFLAACSLRTGTHDAAQPTRRQQPPTARAAATHRSPNRSRCHRTPPTPRITSPRSSKPSRTHTRLPCPSMQRQHACNRHSSSTTTQIGSAIGCWHGLAEHMVRTVPTGHQPASSSQARRGMPTGAAQPAAAKSAPSTYHTHPSAGKRSEKSTCFRHRRSRCSLPPDDGHSSWPASRQLKPPVAPQSPHATIRRIRAPRGSYCTTWRKKSHSGPERRGGAKAGEIGLPQPHTKQRD